MSKKSALGNIPTFDLGGSVNNINGISVSNEAPKETPKPEAEMLTKANINDKNIPEEKFLKALEKEKERFKQFTSDNSLNEAKERLEKMQITEKPKKTDNRPSNKKHLKEGYTRQTFAVKDEQLELLRALALYKGIEQKQLLEALLNKAFDSIDTTLKKKALEEYRTEETEDNLDLFI